MEINSKLRNHRLSVTKSIKAAHNCLATGDSSVKTLMNASHIEFGSDNIAIKSTFSANFDKKTAERVKISETLKKSIVESHFGLGNSPMMMKTNFQREFVNSKTTSKALSKTKITELKREHFDFGCSKPSSLTTHNKFFIKMPNSRQDLSPDKLIDLKNSHFKLGSDQLNYSLTSNHKNSKEFVMESIPNRTFSAMKITNFALGPDTVNYSTAYNENHVKVDHRPESTHNSHRFLTSSVTFGAEKFPISLSQASFKRPDPVDTLVHDKKLIKNLKSHHFSLGNDRNCFKTSNSQVGIGKGEPGQLNTNLLKDLNASHFQIGSNPVLNKSTTHIDFKKHSQNDNKKKSFRNAMKSNFAIGDGNTVWMTEHQNKFNWSKNTGKKDIKVT